MRCKNPGSAARRCGPWLALLVAAAVLVSACSRPPPEERLRARIAQMQEAAEARKPARFLDGVAEDFGGRDGMDRAALRAYLNAQLLRNERVSATLGPLDVEMRGDRALVRFSMMLTGGSGGLLPDTVRPWAVRTAWRDEDGEWRLIHAEWEPVL